MATLIKRTSEVAVPASKLMRSMTWGLPNVPSSGGFGQIRRIPLRPVGFPASLDNPSKFPSTSTCMRSNMIWNHLFTRSLSTSRISQKNADSGSGSIARQNFHDECEANINQQINLELYASYVYMSMAYYFDRDDVALPGFHKYFRKSSDEERGHAEKLMKYLNMRGGRIILKAIEKPPRDDWASPLEAATAALELEKAVNQSLLALHTCAEHNNDPQLGDFLEGDFLESQVEDIKELADMIATLQRVGPGLGEYTFDEDLGNQSD